MDLVKTIYTIGHSNRTFDEFVRILKHFSIELLVDIRSLPGSRKFPHFDKEQLILHLPEHQVEYVHLLKLGGRRKANKESMNTRWRHMAFRGYADYMESAEFAEGIQELESAAVFKRACYMCSEAVWWSCHRSMVSDYLKASNWQVFHIMTAGKSTPHSFTKPARFVDGMLTYKEEVH